MTYKIITGSQGEVEERVNKLLQSGEEWRLYSAPITYRDRIFNSDVRCFAQVLIKD